MSNYNSLKTTIDANIKQNGRQEITGQILNSVLNQMVTTLGAGYQFAGVATTATNPGSPDAKVFYIANGKGTYTNFGGIEVTEDEVVVLYWDSSWHKVSTGIASQEKLTELEAKVGSEKSFSSESESAKFDIKFLIGQIVEITNLSSNNASVYFYNDADEMVKTISLGLLPNSMISVRVPDNASKIGGYCAGGYNIKVKFAGKLTCQIEENSLQLSNIAIKRRVDKWFNTTCNINAQVYSASNRLGLRNIISINKGTKINIKTNGQLTYLAVFSRLSSDMLYSIGFTTKNIEYTASEDCGYYVVLKNEDDSDISTDEALAVVEEVCQCNIGKNERLNLMPARNSISLTTYIDLSTGLELPSENFACTPDYLDIDSTKIYKLYSFSQIRKTIDNVYISMYDENKSFLGSLQINGSTTIEKYGNVSVYKDIDFFIFPLRARYIRVSADRNEILGLAISEDYTLSLLPEKIMPILTHNMVSVSRLGYNSLNVREELPKYPQGQIVSFTAAKNAGFDTILFNILYTKDGIAVISHDEDISLIMAVNKDGSQITSSVKISEHTLDELQEYDYGLKYGNDYRGLKLLTIDEGLKWARMANMNVDIEIETGESKERINAIADKIKKYGLEKQCMFFAYYASALADIPNRLPYAQLHVWGQTSDEDIITAMNSALSLKNSTNHVMVSVNYPTMPSEDTINILIANGIGFSWGNVSDNNLIIDSFLAHPYLMYASRISTYVEPISLTMIESQMIR